MIVDAGQTFTKTPAVAGLSIALRRRAEPADVLERYERSIGIAELFSPDIPDLAPAWYIFANAICDRKSYEQARFVFDCRSLSERAASEYCELMITALREVWLDVRRKSKRHAEQIEADLKFFGRASLGFSL